VEDTEALLASSISKKCQTTIRPPVEELWVAADAALLQNALLNLGINASHAMEAHGGEIVIAWSRYQRTSDDPPIAGFDLEMGDYVCLHVTDHGDGIAAENIDKIFDPFFTTKKQGEGTGLGLAAVFGIALSHNGAISVRSEQHGAHKGTTFTLWIPASAPEHRETAPSSHTMLAPSFDTGRGAVLIVDDELMLRELAAELLQSLGYQTIQAADGAECLRLFEQHESDITAVLLDMVMPVMDGNEVLRGIRQRNQQVHVVIASGYSPEKTLRELEALGIQGFVAKPYPMKHLQDAFQALAPSSEVRLV
jgi:CheY-like chemotaxis protein